MERWCEKRTERIEPGVKWRKAAEDRDRW